MSGMSGRLREGNCCKSCWYRGLMLITGMALRRPDKTGHIRTLGLCRLPMAAMTQNTAGRQESDVRDGSQMSDKAEGVFTCQRVADQASMPSQRGTEGKCWMLNAKTARIARSAGPKNSSPSTLREFVALFCTKKRDKRRVWGWEVVDWQGVTNIEESA